MKNVKALTDDELVSLYAEGNNEAFDTLLNKYQSRLFSYIYYVVRNEDVANDLFQETFLKALVRIQKGQYRSNGKFNAWITRIAHNLIMDHFRSKEQENLVSNGEADYDIFNSTLLSEHTVEDQMLIAQSLTDAKNIMSCLPPSQSEVVRMRFYENMSFKEIADKLGLSINTALGRMRYAVINMRSMAQERNMSFYAE